MPASVVVVGLGNRFLHDDAVGIRVAEALARLKRKDQRLNGVEVKQYEEMDLSLLQEFGNASRLIVVDAARSGTAPGSVSVYGVAESQETVERLPSLHELDVTEMIGLARTLGIVKCPVRIVGIEPGDLSLGEGLSTAVERAVPSAVEAVLAEISTPER